MAKATFYRDVHDMAGSSQAWYIDHILTGITEGKWKAEVERVRALYPPFHLKGEEYKAAKHVYQEAKKKLPNFTVSGIFTRCENDKLALFSGFIGIDFDGLEDVNSTYAALANDAYTYALFKSVSGHGICVIVKVEKGRFLDAFHSLEAYYMERYELMVDPSGKNLARRRYVSFDPTYPFADADGVAQLTRPDVPVFKTYLPKPKAKKAEKLLFFVNTASDLEHLFRQIEDRKVDLTANYDDWYQLGFAFINEFGEGGLDYFLRVSQFNANFTSAECEKKFATLLRQKPRTVTISKFYSLCKRAGLDILSDRTKSIAKIAQMQKKAGSSRESIGQTLEKMDGIPQHESKPVIDAVFDSGAVVETEESVFDKIAMYINRNCPLRYNVIKHRVEFVETGEDLDDQQENSLYIKLKNAFGKEITKPEMLSYVYSAEIPQYHPIQDFFEKNKHRRPTGVIEKLCNSITPELNDYAQKLPVSFVKYYLTRFLIGMVGSVYGDISPLTPVFTGKGNTGKTTFWRKLLPEPLLEYYTESKMDGGKDDEFLMATKWLIMNDEFGGNGKDAKHFKNLTSKTFIQIRKVYGRHSEAIQRLAVFAGTCQEDEVIDDPTTDNRRIIPIKVKSINHDLYNSIDKTDLFMEAYHLYKENVSHHLNKEEILQLKLCTEQFEEYSLERELVSKYFRRPDKEDSKLVQEFLSATEIKIRLEKDSVQRISLKRLGAELKAMGYEQEIKPINRINKRGYYVIALNQ